MFTLRKRNYLYTFAFQFHLKLYVWMNKINIYIKSLWSVKHKSLFKILKTSFASFPHNMNHTLWNGMIRLNREQRSIAPDKALFSAKNIHIFLISAWKHMLWVLIRSASPRCFWWVPTTYVFMQKEEKNINLIPPLIRSYGIISIDQPVKHPVSSVPVVPVNVIYSSHLFCKWTLKALIGLYGCADGSGLSLFICIHMILLIF